MRSTGKVLLLVLASTLVWIVVLAPASVVTRGLPANLPLVLQGISGTLWSGSVARAALTQHGQVLVQGRLTWRVRPLSLLHLSPCVELGFITSGLSSAPAGSAAQSGSAAGIACMSIGGDVALHDINFDLPAEYFLRSGELRLGGVVSGRVSSLTWQSGALTALSGDGLWSDARILGNEVDIALQTLPFVVHRESDDSILVQIDNSDLLGQQVDTPLHVSLQTTLSLDGSFHSRAKLTVQSQTPDSLVGLLDVMAEPHGAGLYKLEIRSQH